MTNPVQLNLDPRQPIYKNKLLFTEHFLEQRIKDDAEWEKAHEGARLALAKLQAKRLEIHPENLSEAQLEVSWIQWIFSEILDMPHAVQVILDYGDNKYGKPDYALLPSKEAAANLGKEKQNPASLKGALALAEAKAWGVNLDKATKENPSPAKQLDNYLYYSELPWGVLTDGCYWRLYERSRSKWNEYYEVNLAELLQQNDVNQFLYFYLFFRREAFSTGWLNQVLKRSQDFAETLRDSLEEQVFSALEDIAQGFLDYRSQIEKPPTAATLAQIYQESLVLLYRLLFIFYAESRGILPMQNEDYKQRSLASIAKEAKHRYEFPAQSSANDTVLYARMDDLFYIIDAGDAATAIPAYNGKLFNKAEHPFLAEKRLGDKHLAPAIHKLATLEVQRERGKVRVSVDYQDLEVSHLGTIYEKLLEYQLAIASEPLVLSGKDEIYKPATGNQKPVKKIGDVYLRTGNNQRKVTGSYYTPDYIVRFIVEKTLQPLLLEITGRYASQRADGTWQVNDAPALRDAILAINVLDPATGSGHFAVDVVAYIADWLGELALDLPESAQADEGYWMRQVAANCIYAVDINPLAVELAKLSLWLKTLAQDKPLSFLDHHIRLGNSLVGASLAEIEELAPAANATTKKRRKKVAESQAPLFGEELFTKNVQGAVSRMQQIEGLQAQNVHDVKRQEAIYEELRERLRPYEQLANIWTAREFGLAIKEGEWEAVYKLILAQQPTPRVREIAEAAEAIAQQREMRFFHWDLAFPEVFFDATGQRRPNAGFDAVVGNPPYVRQESIKTIKPFLQTHYSDVYDGQADLYIFFYRQGLELLREERRLAFITPNKWLSAGYGENLRGYLAENADVSQIVDFGHAPIFKGVDTFPMITILSPTQKKEAKQATICDFPREELIKRLKSKNAVILDDYVNENSHLVPMKRFSSQAWNLEPIVVEQLMQKIRRLGQPLQEFLGLSPNYGIKTGFNDAFLIDNETRNKLISNDPNCKTIIRPYLRGQDIKRWQPEWAKLWMIVLKSSENHTWDWSKADNPEQKFQETYPSIYKHMKGYEQNLRKRSDQGRYWWELRSCAYYDMFNVSKINIQRIAYHSRFCFDSVDNFMLNDSAVFIPTDDLWLLSLLNSPLFWHFGFRYFPHKKDEALALDIAYIENLPIVKPSDEIRNEVEKRVEQSIHLTKNYQEGIIDTFDWLHLEFGITSFGQTLENFAAIDEETFIKEVQERGTSRLTAASIRMLKEHYAEYQPALSGNRQQQVTLEAELSNLVNRAYELLPEEIELMWHTAPPRMPIDIPLQFKKD